MMEAACPVPESVMSSMTLTHNLLLLGFVHSLAITQAWARPPNTGTNSRQTNGNQTTGGNQTLVARAHPYNGYQIVTPSKEV